MTHTEFYGLTTINAFRNRIRSPQHRPTADGSGLTLACLSETANTYSPTAHLHQESQCLYSDNALLAALESMNSGQWILFLIQFISASYLIILNIAILYYILVIFAI